MLDMKSWMKENDDVHTDYHKFIQIRSIEGTKLIEMLTSFNHYFISSTANLEILHIHYQQ